MYLKIFIFQLICIYLLTGCEFRAKSNNVENDHKEYRLKHKQHCEIFLAQPQIAVSDSFLILVSHKESNGICQLYSIEKNMEKVCTYGRIGNGPYEFLQPVLTYASGNSFGLNDVNLTTLAIMQIEQKDDSVSIKEVKRMKAHQMKRGKLWVKDVGFVKIGDDCYVSRLSWEDGCFFNLLDSLLQPIMCFGESPVKEELPGLVSMSRLTGKSAVYGGTYFYASTKLPYLASYKLQDDKMVKDWNLFYRKPHYGVSNGDLKFSKENSTGPLLDIRVDSDNVYLLYLDQLLSEYDYTRTDKSLSDKIFVFNHKGEKKAILHLDCRLSQIAIDSKRKKIYGISENPDISLVEFDLPEF